MKIGALSLVLPLVIAGTLSTTSVAQTRRRGTTPRKPAATTAKPDPAATQPAGAQPTTPQPVTPRRPTGPVNLVVLNGQTLTTADLPPAVREQLDQVEDKIAAARKEI
ncbi:MAG TPA: hypothetical protein VJS17_09115, partial [Pyrinomonadaceae bacterium]|nr:hypothetical protein [Pyrinomonadaceae bacterium]